MSPQRRHAARDEIDVRSAFDDGLPLVLPARAYRLTGVMPLIVAIAGMTPVVDPSAFVAPTAAVLGNAEIDARASIFHGASVRADSAAIRIDEKPTSRTTQCSTPIRMPHAQSGTE